MENKIKEFMNEKFGNVRTLVIDEKVMFVAKDIATSLGYANTNKAIKDHCKKALMTWGNDSLGRRQEFKVISKSDIYRLIVRSKLPDAEEFECWLFEVVLPQIELTGGYIPVKEEDTPDVIMAKALKIADKTIQEKDAIIESMKEKVDIYDSIMNTDGTFDINAVSKLVGVGEYKLFEYLRSKKILFYNSIKDNVPYQRFMDEKKFKVIDTIGKDGQPHSTTRVYQKGIDYIIKLLKKDNLYNPVEVHA
jgi:anti-repressor protein